MKWLINNSYQTSLDSIFNSTTLHVVILIFIVEVIIICYKEWIVRVWDNWIRVLFSAVWKGKITLNVIVVVKTRNWHLCTDRHHLTLNCWHNQIYCIRIGNSCVLLNAIVIPLHSFKGTAWNSWCVNSSRYLVNFPDLGYRIISRLLCWQQNLQRIPFSWL